MFHPRVHQLDLEEGIIQLSMHHRGLHRLHILVRLPHWHPSETYMTGYNHHLLQVW
jgi:hypothetical protein